MRINYVNNEMLWLQSTLLLAVEDGEMSQTGISITQLRGIYLNRSVHNSNNK